MPKQTSIITGKVWRFGSDISTDDIISGVHLSTTDIMELTTYTFQHLRPEFAEKVQVGDIIAAGEHFGIGSSREEAPALLKQLGIGAVVAASFARIFFRNAFNIGLPAIECPELKSDPEIIREGDVLEINLQESTLINQRTKKSYQITKVPPFLLAYLEAGGAIPLLKKRLNAR
ncbi:MAG: 3-isopropylmalate dehydratase small subunit [Promethearchaeota archaeon]